MDLEQLQELVDKDLKINDTELDLEALKTPQLHNKYMKYLTKFKLMLSRADTEYNSLKREKWEYYTGKAPAEVYALKPFDLKILKTDIDKYLDSDEELQRQKQKVDYLQTTVDFLDRTIRQISNRGFLIKDAIDWRKFTSGAI
jgi:acetone carboxylase gamma subunit